MKTAIVTESKQNKFEYTPPIPAKVARDKRLKGGRSREYWAYLNYRCYNKGYCYQTIETAAWDLGMSPRTISSYNKLLSKLGYITIKPNAGRDGANLYIIHDLKDVKIPAYEGESPREQRVKRTLEKILTTIQENQEITNVEAVNPTPHDESGSGSAKSGENSGIGSVNLPSSSGKTYEGDEVSSTPSFSKDLPSKIKSINKERIKEVKIRERTPDGVVSPDGDESLKGEDPLSKPPQTQNQHQSGDTPEPPTEEELSELEWFSTLIIQQRNRTKDKEHRELLDQLMAKISFNGWPQDWFDDWCVLVVEKDEDEAMDMVEFLLSKKELLADGGVNNPFQYVLEYWDILKGEP